MTDEPVENPDAAHLQTEEKMSELDKAYYALVEVAEYVPDAIFIKYADVFETAGRRVYELETSNDSK